MAASAVRAAPRRQVGGRGLVAGGVGLGACGFAALRVAVLLPLPVCGGSRLGCSPAHCIVQTDPGRRRGRRLYYSRRPLQWLQLGGGSGRLRPAAVEVSARRRRPGRSAAGKSGGRPAAGNLKARLQRVPSRRGVTAGAAVRQTQTQARARGSVVAQTASSPQTPAGT